MKPFTKTSLLICTLLLPFESLLAWELDRELDKDLLLKQIGVAYGQGKEAVGYGIQYMREDIQSDGTRHDGHGCDGPYSYIDLHLGHSRTALNTHAMAVFDPGCNYEQTGPQASVFGLLDVTDDIKNLGLGIAYEAGRPKNFMRVYIGVTMAVGDRHKNGEAFGIEDSGLGVMTGLSGRIQPSDRFIVHLLYMYSSGGGHADEEIKEFVDKNGIFQKKLIKPGAGEDIGIHSASADFRIKVATPVYLNIRPSITRMKQDITVTRGAPGSKSYEYNNDKVEIGFYYQF